MFANSRKVDREEIDFFEIVKQASNEADGALMHGCVEILSSRISHDEHIGNTQNGDNSTGRIGIPSI